MDAVQAYKNRLKELENDPVVREYLYIQRIISLTESKEYKIRVNSPKAIIPEKLEALDNLEREEQNEVLKLLRYTGRASTVNDINNSYFEFNYVKADLKYKIRHQYKKGNIYLLRYNQSRKFSFYVLPEWIVNGELPKVYFPHKKDIPLNIDSIRLTSYDDKINKEVL